MCRSSLHSDFSWYQHWMDSTYSTDARRPTLYLHPIHCSLFVSSNCHDFLLGHFLAKNERMRSFLGLNVRLGRWHNPNGIRYCIPKYNYSTIFFEYLILFLSVYHLDFSYPAPLCMEKDTRPAIVGEFHYMYFAALLFWLTGITSIIISLITPPDDQYRV